MWTVREFSVAEAAALSGIHRSAIDIIIHRARDCEPLFSEKRGSRRWFSRRDIAVLRVAYELERAGRNWLTAIAQAFEHLGNSPPPDALLVVPVLSVSSRSGRVLTGLRGLPPSSSMIVIPIGIIAAEIVERAANLKEAS